MADKRPEVQLSGTVEFDEVYVTAGHKGQHEAVTKRRQGRRRKLKGFRGRGTLEKEKPPIFGMIQRGGERGHQNAGECSTADHQTDYSGNSERWDAHLHR